jgi:transcriptional regulator with XRE-family HTH domain
METKIKRSHIDLGFGFPVKLMNVPMTRVRGEWTPAINYNLLAEVVLKELCEKSSRLTGNEVRFIRQHFEMTLQQFAKRFGVTHPAVMKWENMKNRCTGINWATEKDIRLFALLKLSSKSSEIVELYKFLEAVIDSQKSTEVEVDARKLAA